MTTTAPERHRFQVGLRKLLLWTVVVGILLGIATTLGREESCVFLCGTILVCAIRCGLGFKVAGILTVAAWTTFMVLLSWAIASDIARPLGEATLIGSVYGGLVGLAMFGIAEGLVRAVNWADKMLETRGDGGTRRD
jgi:hypothetical protein